MTAPDLYRPAFHYTAERNWLNDPNGLVWFDGEYHLFYQYNPFGDQWGHMSWGHAVSPDLVHWQELPVAIPEDERVSIYSGSVVVDTHNCSGFGDGTAPPLVAVYTGCLRRPEGGQAQELACSRDRGRTWTKYAGNPVLDLGLRDFRDPKVFWHAPAGRWVMVVSVPDQHRLSFYGSVDLKAWSLLSHFDAPTAGQGIWECPDLIELPVQGGGTAWMLKVDVFEGHPSQGSGARLFFGHFDGTRFTAEPSAHCWADHGADFYAALSWAHLPDGRAVWIGWMNCHRYAKHLPTSPWRGAMSLPRTLALQRRPDGLRLLQQPVPELAALRGPAVVHAPCEIGAAPRALAALDAAAGGLEVDCSWGPGAAREFGLLLQAGPDAVTRIGYDADRGTVFIDRTHGGLQPPDALFAGRREAPCPPPRPGQPLRLQVWIDRCSVEVFADGGAAVITEQVFPPPGLRRLVAYAERGPASLTAATTWTLRSSTAAARQAARS